MFGCRENRWFSLNIDFVGYADMPVDMGGTRGGVGSELWSRICAKRGRRIHSDNPESKKNGGKWRTSSMQQFQDWGTRKGGDHHRQPHFQEEEASLSAEDQAFFGLSYEYEEFKEEERVGLFVFPFRNLNFWLIFFVGWELGAIYIYILKYMFIILFNWIWWDCDGRLFNIGCIWVFEGIDPQICI